MPENQVLIAGLREYIRNNKALDEVYAKVSASPAHVAFLETLKTVFRTGERQEWVFYHPHCSLAVLALIEDGTFPFWEGLTLYFYCMALMQYTDEQPLREGDEDYQLNIGKPTISFILKEGKLTDEGERYLASIEAKCKKIPGYRFDKEAFIAHLNEQSPIARWLIHLPREKHPYLRSSYHDLMRVLVKDIAYVGEEVFVDTVTLPSLVAMNFLNAAQDNAPLTFKPCFGSVSAKTLMKLHEAEMHPLALYSPWVKSNSVRVHDFEGGPVGAFLHDVAHTFWANLFTKAERDVMMKDVIPAMIGWTTHPEVIFPDEVFYKAVNHMIFECQDYNLSPLDYYLGDRSDRLFTHLIASITGRRQPVLQGVYTNANVIHLAKPVPLWNLKEDHLFLACMRTMLQKQATEAPTAALWERIHEMNLTAFKYTQREPHILNAIIAEAYRLEGCEPPRASRAGLFARNSQGELARVSRGETMNPRAQVS